LTRLWAACSTIGMRTDHGPRRAPKSRGPRVRTIHLVDVENLCGSGAPASTYIRRVRDVYDIAAATSSDDLVVIGGSLISTLEAYDAWGSARYVMREGKNGADLALLDVVMSEGVAERFDRVVLGSGDGIFAESVSALGAAGCRVTVVARRASISRRLRMAAADVHLIDLSEPAPLSALVRCAA